MGNEKIALYVTPANYRLCRSLTEAVKGFDEGSRIVWFGNALGMNGTQFPADITADGVILWEPEQTLCRLAEADNGWDEEVEGFIPVSGMHAWNGAAGKAAPQLQPEEPGDAGNGLDCLNGVWEETLKQRWPAIPSIKCADRNGAGHSIRTHSKERFREDLNLAARQLGPDGRLAIEGFQYLNGKKSRKAVCKALAALKQRTAGYSAEVPLEWILEQSEYTGLLEAGITQIKIRVPITMNELQYDQALQLTESLKDTPEGVKLAVVLTDEVKDDSGVDAANTAVLLTHWVTEGLLQAGDVKLEITGFAPAGHKITVPESIGSFLQRHLQQEEEQALINGFMAYMTGQYPHQVRGSGIKHIGYTGGEWNQATMPALAEYSGINSAVLFESHPLRSPSDSDILFGDQDGVWKQENDAYEAWERQSEQHHYYLSNAHQINRLGENQYELQLNDFLQLEPLEIRQLHYLQAEAMNEAASGRAARFQLLNLESAEDMERFLEDVELFSTTGTFRFLPEYLDRQQYCELRKKHKLLHRYMQMVQVFKGLNKYARVLHNIGVHELRVSLPACTHLWKQAEPHTPVDTAVQETVFLFYTGDQPMLFHAVSQKLLKLNEPMALILEGLMSGADGSRLEQELAARYQVEEEIAARLVTEALGLFAKEGCLVQAAKAV
ncbi:hypothetical protein KC345_g3383 [Hortaea werneckii]|nr:hypothetical protein KC345_g3383 [Hortaea werneckii]